MSYLNFIKDIEIFMPPIRSCRMDGEFALEAFRGVEFPRGSGQVFEIAGTRRTLMPWRPNIITDYGLNLFGNTTSYHHCEYGHVGSGNATPSAADTGLQVWIAADAYNSRVASAQSTPPYYGQAVWRYRFAPGFGGGNVNISEVGVGRSPTNVNLTSRALTVDSGGDPLTISVLADEYLDMYYKRRNYPGHIVEATGAPTDDQGTVDIAGTTYTYTIRPAAVTYGGAFGSGSTSGWGTGSYLRFDTETGFIVNYVTLAHPGATSCSLGAVTSGLSGYQPENCTIGGRSGSYVTDSFNQDLYYQWTATQANDPGGIGGLVIKTTLGAYQLVFDQNIPKEDPMTFTWYHNFSWARKSTWV